ISARRSSMAARHTRSRRAGLPPASAGRGVRRVARRAARRGAFFAVLPVEALDPARRVHELLLAGGAGGAGRADLGVDDLPRGASLDDIAARADDGALVVAGMNAFLHGEKLRLLTGGASGRNPPPGHPLPIFFKHAATALPAAARPPHASTTVILALRPRGPRRSLG